ncbi:hypothetical protein CEXT_797401 [Caerostris extrusa]|uniref:Uncharacterized protein n=1 Tax=Caerostris extrusa TaxID=172846 RepID=A0AAV4NH91_CAEEX|nr:hypothetical protein CEXT_797401 [Caerostris extrusa]
MGAGGDGTVVAVARKLNDKEKSKTKMCRRQVIAHELGGSLVRGKPRTAIYLNPVLPSCQYYSTCMRMDENLISASGMCYSHYAEKRIDISAVTLGRYYSLFLLLNIVRWTSRDASMIVTPS